MTPTQNGCYESCFKTNTDDFEEKIENYHKNWQIFDESALFKGRKSHDADPVGVSLWYQNELSYKYS